MKSFSFLILEIPCLFCFLSNWYRSFIWKYWDQFENLFIVEMVLKFLKEWNNVWSSRRNREFGSDGFPGEA